jgi:hypothetical protein
MVESAPKVTSKDVFHLIRIGAVTGALSGAIIIGGYKYYIIPGKPVPVGINPQIESFHRQFRETVKELNQALKAQGLDSWMIKSKRLDKKLDPHRIRIERRNPDYGWDDFFNPFGKEKYVDAKLEKALKENPQIFNRELTVKLNQLFAQYDQMKPVFRERSKAISRNRLAWKATRLKTALPIAGKGAAVGFGLGILGGSAAALSRKRKGQRRT